MTTEEKVQTAFLNMMEQISFTEITVTALSKKKLGSAGAPSIVTTHPLLQFCQSSRIALAKDVGKRQCNSPIPIVA